MTMTKVYPPGEDPTPDNQGKSNTCTRYGLSKALTGGLQDGTFGPKLDVTQGYVTSALVNKVNDVGGRWPTDFDQETVLAMDRKSLEYYNIALKVVECSFAELQQNWKKSKFVVVYNKTAGLHCIYVKNFKNGKLCCINSYGKKDQFPKLKPDEVFAIYKVDATARKAPATTQMSPKTNKKNAISGIQSISGSQTNLTKADVLEAENVVLKQRNKELEQAIENFEMLAAMNRENEKLEKATMEKGSIWDRISHKAKKVAKKVSTAVSSVKG